MNISYERATQLISRSLGVKENQLIESFKPAKLEELPEVARLRSAHFGEELGSEQEDINYLRWRYFSRTGFDSTLWIVKLGDRLMAVIGTEPVSILAYRNGEEVSFEAVRNMDAAIAPEFNGSGLGAWMTLAMQHMHETVIVSGGNEQSSSMLEKLFRGLKIRHYYRYLIKSKSFLVGRMPMRLARLLHPFVDVILFFNRKCVNRIARPKDIDFEHVDIERFLKLYPSRFGRGMSELMVERTQEYYRWRLGRHEIDYRALVALKEGALSGYIIYVVDAKGANKSAYLLDWNVKSECESETNLIAYLMWKAIEHCSVLGASDVTAIMNDSKSSISAEKIGIKLRATKSNFFVYSQDDEIRKLIESSEAWFHSYVDTDGL